MYIVTAKEMYDIDHFTINEVGLDGKLLMENAGRAVCEKITHRIKKTDKITVLVGAGNNGGDGFVIARTLLNDNYNIEVVQVVSDEKITGDALYHKNLYLNFGGKVWATEQLDKRLDESQVIIDALIGIGVQGELREPIASVVSLVNEKANYIISVDIPSGLPADEGIQDFQAVQADYTVIIGALKMSVFLKETSFYYGEWDLVSIGLASKGLSKFSNRQLTNRADVAHHLPTRGLYDHKGDHGRGLIIGGNDQMPGAVSMSACASLKSGAGLITAGTTKKVIQSIASECVEAMYLELPDHNGYVTDIGNVNLNLYDAVAIGVGIGRDRETTSVVLKVAQDATCPLLLDADGLYHVRQDLSVLKNREKPTILTPHPGEMAMLMDTTVSEIINRPFYYSYSFAKKLGVYVVLKGRYTIITAPDGQQAVNSTGNPGLAKGGSGDVLTGIMLAMIMQKDSIFDSLKVACYIHGMAADLQVKERFTFHDLMASDVIDGIGKTYRTFLK